MPAITAFASVIFDPEEIGHRLASGRVIEFPVVTLRLLCVPTFETHFERTVVRSKRILFVQRDVAHNVSFENAVVLRKTKTERVRARIVEIYSVEDLELGSERIFRIYCKGNVPRSAETHAREASRIVCLRQCNLVSDESGSEGVPCSGLDAE